MTTKKTCLALGSGLLLAVSALGGCGGSGDSGTPNVRPPGGVAPFTTAAESEEQASSQPLEPVLTTPPPSRGVQAPLTPATQEPPPPPHNLTPCKTASMNVRVLRQLGTSKNGPGVGLVALTNTGVKTCALSGWPTVGLTRGGSPVGVPTTNVNKPRKPVGMALQPDRTAFAGVQWRACPPTATGCKSGDGFRVGAPGSGTVQAQLSGFTTAEQKGFSASSIVIGSLQPTTTDIINW